MKYVRNEWMKLWSKKGPWIMLVLLLLVIVGYAGIEKYFEVKNNTAETWREEVQASMEMHKDWLAEEENPDPYIAEQIQLLQYQLDNDIAGYYVMTFSDMMSFGTDMIVLVTIFAVVVAADIVSSEFGAGTIKMLLTRPAARWKILLSKLVTVVLYGFTLFVIGVAVSALVGVILFGTGSSVELQIVDGAVKEFSPWSLMAEGTLLSLGDFFISIIFAFLIGSLFRSSSLAVGITLVCMLMGSTIVMMLSKYEFTKYIWLAHSDLTQHMEGRSPMIEGVTLGYSIGVLAIYAIVFLIITFASFQKRDVTA